MQNCLHCLERLALSKEVLCEICIRLPRCEVCTGFFDGIMPPSEENMFRHEDCLNFEERIKLTCIFCPALLPLYMNTRSLILRFVIRGNCCGKCSRELEERARRAQRRGRRDRYEGYLSLMYRKYQAGEIGNEQWEELKELNPQDVNYPDAKH